ncbi:hypothetical protein Val02_23480 [Virgisporangium aliadipatigenens]|uniref:Uncharacterized protein n=1 Tax=Virgisporangium aliadipatigenens TaxID=741659 RepID=A0A8J4DQK6_9ACTN|nr:hypothetical protein [Virgisporangium aliadipatigenens]GIJ45462.1 hypothetical protein Val02_23480 [Virgisporangium aliadipatigenens]
MAYLELRRAAPANFIVVGVCAVAIVVALLAWPRASVVEVYPQPSTVVYDGATHYAAHVRMHAFVGVDRHEVVLGSDPTGADGHRVRLDAPGLDRSRLAVEWTAEGVWVAFGSGHRVFVPARFFV